LDLLTPVLVLQPLVENAVRHATATAAPGEVSVAACKRGSCLVLTVANAPAPHLKRISGEGAGHAIITERLKANYGDRAKMEIGSGGDTYVVNVVLPCEAAA
jgi:LytS/YehU family sensor histidine kinase